MTSIRLRTAALAAMSMSALLIVGGVALYAMLSRSLAAQFDDALIARAQALQSVTHFDGTKVEVDLTADAAPSYGMRQNAEYFVVWIHQNSRWTVVRQSESLAGRPWPLEQDLAVSDGPVRDIVLPHGVWGRMATASFVPTGDLEDPAPKPSDSETPSARLLVAIPREPLDRTLALVAWCIGGVSVAMALASIGAAWWAVSRGLRPLNDLSTRVQSLGPETLNTRFDARGLPDELRPIAEQLSELLARLEEAFEREKRFGAAASHELRTPIAELLSLLEVAASRERTSTEWAATAQTALGVLERARGLCETLLRLSRAGAKNSAPMELTPLAPVLATESMRAAAFHHREPACISMIGGDNVAARIDAAALASIVGNLLDNALRYGDVSARTPVTIHARSHNERPVIEVANSAPGLTAEDCTHLFEPFWRKDESRQDQRGFGLGLSVAQALARASGGELDATLDARGTLCMRLTLQGS